MATVGPASEVEIRKKNKALSEKHCYELEKIKKNWEISSYDLRSKASVWRSGEVKIKGKVSWNF